MWRIPIFSWEIVATALLDSDGVSFTCGGLRDGAHRAAPGAATSSTRVTAGIRCSTSTFSGSSDIPELYVMILPYFGIVTEIIATFSRKPVFGYVGLVVAAFAIAGLSLGVWAHHMFTTGAVSNPFFSAVSFLIAVAYWVKFVNWIGTMWKGSIELSVPMLFAIGFMLNFLIGGITGVMIASPLID